MRHTGLLLRLPNRTSVSYLSKNGVTEKLDWKQTMAFTSQVNARDALLLGAGIVPDMAFDQCVDYLKDGRIVPGMDETAAALLRDHNRKGTPEKARQALR